MRILVQNCKTFEFYTEKDVWTKSSSEAHEFGSSAEALELCRRYPDTQIIFKFEKDVYDLRFPVTEGCKDLEAGGSA
jgi:hypothetical protein